MSMGVMALISHENMLGHYRVVSNDIVSKLYCLLFFFFFFFNSLNNMTVNMNTRLNACQDLQKRSILPVWL